MLLTSVWPVYMTRQNHSLPNSDARENISLNNGAHITWQENGGLLVCTCTCQKDLIVHSVILPVILTHQGNCVNARKINVCFHDCCQGNIPVLMVCVCIPKAGRPYCHFNQYLLLLLLSVCQWYITDYVLSPSPFVLCFLCIKMNGVE